MMYCPICNRPMVYVATDTWVCRDHPTPTKVQPPSSRKAEPKK